MFTLFSTLLQILPRAIVMFGLHLNLHGNPISWHQYKKETLSSLSFIEGSCSPEKAEKMMDLIYEIHPEVCVEIGVMEGACTFPTAAALKYQGQGKVFAIDPWISGDNIFLHFKLMLHGFQVFDLCRIMRMTSAKASLFFDDASIDILHIDGNLSEALHDVKMYLPKVKTGGFIWLNNAHLESIQPALQYLAEHCALDPIRSTTKCFLYEKN
jgi:predicted O-methyltransferase YrrM